MTDTAKHLLLVEDEAPLRQAVAEQLVDRGYRVEQADSGERALGLLTEFAFDVIVSDLRLPGIDGASLVQAAVDRYPDIIAIVITDTGPSKAPAKGSKRGGWISWNSRSRLTEWSTFSRRRSRRRGSNRR